MKLTKENDVVRACLEALSIWGVMAWRSNNVPVYDPTIKRFRKFRGLKGVADILGCLEPDGKLLAIECKKKGGRVSDDQILFIDEVRRRGGLSLVILDVKDLENALRGEGII